MNAIRLPEPCPICNRHVYVMDIQSWDAEEGTPHEITVECEGEPDIGSNEWQEWFNGHYRTPYVDWLPYETRMLPWLQERYRYFGDELEPISKGTP